MPARLPLNIQRRMLWRSTLPPKLWLLLERILQHLGLVIALRFAEAICLVHSITMRGGALTLLSPTHLMCPQRYATAFLEK